MTDVTNTAAFRATAVGDATETGSQDASDDVRLEGACKRFGDVWALRPVSLSIPRGEFFSLLGASGSGKTTTLRIIAGFERPTSGRVLLRGRDVTQDAPYERNVNTVFQDYALFPHMTVGQNVSYSLRVQRVVKGEIARRVDEALQLVQLSGYQHRRPSQLSGGQRQRVALARALINVPDVLLLDEPLGALDLKLRREMQSELKRIQASVGITFLYVTHDQDEAMSMSDRVAVMSDGVIVQVGSPSEVYERPSSAFVAGFVGTSNVLSAWVVQREGQHWRIHVPGIGDMRVRSDTQPDASGRVLVAVRPEKIALRSPGTVEAGYNAVQGRIVTVSYAGAFTRFGVAAGGVELSVVEQNLGSGPSLRLGEEVSLVWSSEATHMLPGSEADVGRGSHEAAAH